MILKLVLGLGLLPQACHVTDFWCAISRGAEMRWPQETEFEFLPTAFNPAGNTPDSLGVNREVQLIAFFFKYIGCHNGR